MAFHDWRRSEEGHPGKSHRHPVGDTLGIREIYHNWEPPLGVPFRRWSVNIVVSVTYNLSMDCDVITIIIVDSSWHIHMWYLFVWSVFVVDGDKMGKFPKGIRYVCVYSHFIISHSVPLLQHVVRSIPSERPFNDPCRSNDVIISLSGYWVTTRIWLT